MFFITAFILGLAGSFHCIGMCGPIALSLPVHHMGTFKKHIGILLYNIGRLLTYSILGLLFGLIGRSFSMIGLQQWVSIALGVLLLVSVIISKIKTPSSLTFPGINKLVNKLKGTLSNLFAERGLRFLLGIGLLNGLLPCGLVYVGIAGAMATQNITEGALFMLAFGLGTVPIMYSVAFAGQFVTIKFRNNVRKAVPYAVSAMALLLILRGMNLGIPYVSPSFDTKTKTMSCCSVQHHKK